MDLTCHNSRDDPTQPGTQTTNTTTPVHQGNDIRRITICRWRKSSVWVVDRLSTWLTSHTPSRLWYVCMPLTSLPGLFFVLYSPQTTPPVLRPQEPSLPTYDMCSVQVSLRPEFLLSCRRKLRKSLSVPLLLLDWKTQRSRCRLSIFISYRTCPFAKLTSRRVTTVSDGRFQYLSNSES